MQRDKVTASDALAEFSYDKASGVLTRISASGSSGRFVGRPSGSLFPNGYLYVRVKGRRFTAHSVIWLMETGAWPKGRIDHIDGCKTNNSLGNLRDVDAHTNAANKHRARVDSKTGVIGVTKDRNRWAAYIFVRGEKHSLGGYATKELAAQARAAAKPHFHKEFRHD